MQPDFRQKHSQSPKHLVREMENYRKPKLLSTSSTHIHPRYQTSLSQLWNLFCCRCRAPIASLDCMEEFNGVESGVHCKASTGTKEQLLTSCISSQSRLQQPSPGIRYRNLGKSGLRVSNVGLGTLSVSPLSPNLHFCIKFSIQNRRITYKFSQCQLPSFF